MDIIDNLMTLVFTLLLHYLQKEGGVHEMVKIQAVCTHRTHCLEPVLPQQVF
jgi:hypothetical protein